MEKGFAETEVFMPIGVGGEASPIRGPMTDEFVVFGRSSCRKPSDPRIDPSDSIRNIRTVDWNLMADEKIFREIDFDPSGEIRFLLCRPSPFFHFPNLMGRFFNASCEGWDRIEKDEEDDQTAHGQY
jgi:hypothetical protein